MRCYFDPSKGQRLGPAWVRLLAELEDQRWRPWSEVIAAVLPGSGLRPKSIESLIYSGIKHGYLIRRGRLRQREVRLISTTTNCECEDVKSGN